MATPKERTFVTILCNNVLVWVEDITNPEQQVMWAALKGEARGALSDDFKSLLVGIKAKPEYLLEVYSITAIDGIKKSDIHELFSNDPQHGLEVIREMGYKIYSDSNTTEESIL